MNCPACGCDVEKYMDKCPNCGTIVFERKKSNTSKAKSSTARKKSDQSSKNIVDLENINQQSDPTIIKSPTLHNEENLSDLTDESERLQTEDYSIEQATSNIPENMDLGKSTKYYCSQRKTPAHMTRWQKFMYKFSPAKDASSDDFEDAAIRNFIVAHLIIIFSIFLIYLSIYYFFYLEMKKFNWMFTVIALFLLIWSRLFLDNAAKNYSYNVVTEKRKFKVSKTITAVLIVSDLILSLFFLLYSYTCLLSDLYYAILYRTTGK